LLGSRRETMSYNATIAYGLLKNIAALLLDPRLEL
jgi:hypothetical protein